MHYFLYYGTHCLVSSKEYRYLYILIKKKKIKFSINHLKIKLFYNNIDLYIMLLCFDIIIALMCYPTDYTYIICNNVILEILHSHLVFIFLSSLVYVEGAPGQIYSPL
jgi:hypothetical protein